MIKLSFSLLACFALHAVEIGFAAETPDVQYIDLKNTDIAGIGSLSNSSWNLVGKCCNSGQVFRSEEESEGVKIPGNNQCQDARATEKVEYSPLFNGFNDSGFFDPGLTASQFVAVVGIPCQHGKYMLEPESMDTDQYYLLVNGSVFRPFDIPRMLEPGRDYCMEFVPGRGLTVLVCYQPELKVVTADTRLAFYTVGLLISVPFLLATIVSYLITPKLCDVMGLNLCCYAGCLAVAFLSLAIIQLGGQSLVDSSCVGVAFLTEFSFLACFVWFNAMSIETWLLLRRYSALGSAIVDGRPLPNPCFFYYCLWGWGLPAILIIISLSLNLNPTIPWTYVKHSGEEVPSCAFEIDTRSLPYFYVPVGILVFVNMAIFTVTGFKIAKIQRDLDVQRLARNEVEDRVNRRVFGQLKLTFFHILVLFVIMAINWAMELVSLLTVNNMLAWSVFDFVNALQGVLVFGLFVLRSEVRKLVWRRVKEITGIGRDTVSNGERRNEFTLLPITNNNTSSRLTQ